MSRWAVAVIVALLSFVIIDVLLVVHAVRTQDVPVESYQRER